MRAVLEAAEHGVERYREMVSDLGDARIDLERGREIIRSVADQIPVRPGADGVPIAELSLNEAMPLAEVAGGNFQIGAVAGA